MTFFLFTLWSEFDGRKNIFARKEIITALRDWKMLLISSVIIMVVVAFVNAYLFFQINNEQLFQAGLKEPPVAIGIDKERLERAIKEFEIKAERFDALSREAPKVADPSVYVSVR